MVRCGIDMAPRSTFARDLSSLPRLPAPLDGAWIRMSTWTLSQAAYGVSNPHGKRPARRGNGAGTYQPERKSQAL